MFSTHHGEGNFTQLQEIVGGDASHVFTVGDYSSLTTALHQALLEAVPAATNLSYDVTPAPGWTITGTPSATAGTANTIPPIVSDVVASPNPVPLDTARR